MGWLQVDTAWPQVEPTCWDCLLDAERFAEYALDKLTAMGKRSDEARPRINYLVLTERDLQTKAGADNSDG